MVTDIQEQDAIFFQKNELDATFARNGKRPRTFVFPMQFVGFQAWMECIGTKKVFLPFCSFFEHLRQFAVMPIEKRHRIDAADAHG